MCTMCYSIDVANSYNVYFRNESEKNHVKTKTTKKP